MKKYGVSLPVTGIAYVEVEAESKVEAVTKAFEKEITDADLCEWQTHNVIVSGGVCSAVLNEAYAEEIN